MTQSASDHDDRGSQVYNSPYKAKALPMRRGEDSGDRLTSSPVKGRTRCRVGAKGSVTPCEPLLRCVDSICTRGRGLQQVSLINVKTNKLSRHTYKLRAGEFAKSGVILNYCPICGTDLRPPLDERIVLPATNGSGLP